MVTGQRLYPPDEEPNLFRHGLVHDFALDIVITVLMPLFTMIGAICFAGCLGFFGKIIEWQNGKPNRAAPLWPCLPIALALLAMMIAGLVHLWRLRSRTVRRFEFRDGVLHFQLESSNIWREVAAHEIGDIRHGLLERTILKTRPGQWIALAADTKTCCRCWSNCESLLGGRNRVRSHGGRKKLGN